MDLEENGGNDGNSSVAELEVRVETLEGTAADHETRITTTETDVAGMQFLSSRFQQTVSTEYLNLNIVTYLPF